MYKKILLLTMATLSIYSAHIEGDEFEKYHLNIRCAQGTQAQIIKRKNEFNNKRLGRHLSDLAELYIKYKKEYSDLEKSNNPNFFEGLQSVESLCEHYKLITGGCYNPDNIKFE